MGIGDINARSHLSVDFARSHISVSLDNDAQHLKGVDYFQKVISNLGQNFLTQLQRIQTAIKHRKWGNNAYVLNEVTKKITFFEQKLSIEFQPLEKSKKSREAITREVEHIRKEVEDMQEICELLLKGGVPKHSVRPLKESFKELTTSADTIETLLHNSLHIFPALKEDPKKEAKDLQKLLAEAKEQVKIAKNALKEEQEKVAPYGRGYSDLESHAMERIQNAKTHLAKAEVEVKNLSSEIESLKEQEMLKHQEYEKPLEQAKGLMNQLTKAQEQVNETKMHLREEQQNMGTYGSGFSALEKSAHEKIEKAKSGVAKAESEVKRVRKEIENWKVQETGNLIKTMQAKINQLYSLNISENAAKIKKNVAEMKEISAFLETGTENEELNALNQSLNTLGSNAEKTLKFLETNAQEKFEEIKTYQKSDEEQVLTQETPINTEVLLEEQLEERPVIEPENELTDKVTASEVNDIEINLFEEKLENFDVALRHLLEELRKDSNYKFETALRYPYSQESKKLNNFQNKKLDSLNEGKEIYAIIQKGMLSSKLALQEVESLEKGRAPSRLVIAFRNADKAFKELEKGS